MHRWMKSAAMLAAAAVLFASAPAARALDKITAAAVGGPTGTMWIYYVGYDEGFFKKNGIDLDIIFAHSAPAVMQELAAGSVGVVATDGVVEPIHAADHGADVAIARIIGQSSPYSMEAKPDIKSIKDLKGKTIALGGLVDITAIYWNKVAEANGLKPHDVDIVVIGATAGRFAALKSGTVAASMLLPPFSFHAEDAGFHDIGRVINYVKDVPFTCMAMSRSWAAKHMSEAKRLLKALDESAAWFYTPGNRAALVQMGVKDFHINQKEATESLDFLRQIKYFAPTSKVSKKDIDNLIAIMRASGDVSHPLKAQDLAIPGLTELTN